MSTILLKDEIKVLVVDDQPDVRLLTRAVISAARNGLTVAGEASGGKEALSRVEELDPEIIVMDAMMPGMDGIETAVQIRRRRPGQIIVLCSAYLDDDVRQRAAEAGIVACVPKDRIYEMPVTLRALIV